MMEGSTLAGNKSPILQTERTQLRALDSSDADALFGYRSLPEITRFQGWAPVTADEAKDFIDTQICHTLDQPGTWFQMGIFSLETKTLIGDVGLHFLEEEKDTVEIGITLAPLLQGNGFAQEVIQAVLSFLFETLHKNKIIASVDPDNLKSINLMERTGFRLEGIYQKAFLFRGEWVDDAVFILNRENWQNQR
jgi:RimJ/RimL family protein N-acetyltransferase